MRCLLRLHDTAQRPGRFWIVVVALVVTSLSAAATSSLRDMGPLDRSKVVTFPHAINARGQVVGEHWPDEGRAFVWSNGELTVLATTPEVTQSTALDINDHGDIVGTACTGYLDRDVHAALWRNGELSILGAGQAVAINDRGQVVISTVSYTGGSTHVFLWEHGNRRELPALEGSSKVHALAINGAGQVVGWGGLPQDVSDHAVLWDAGRAIDLGVLPGHRASMAVDINDRGDSRPVERRDRHRSGDSARTRRELVAPDRRPGAGPRVERPSEHGRLPAVPLARWRDGRSHDGSRRGAGPRARLLRTGGARCVGRHGPRDRASGGERRSEMRTIAP